MDGKGCLERGEDEPMSEQPSVSELVLRYRERRQRGESVTPEDACAICPDLLPEVRRQIDALLSMEGLLGQSPPDGTTVAMPAGRDVPLPVIPGYEILGELGR